MVGGLVGVGIIWGWLGSLWVVKRVWGYVMPRLGGDVGSWKWGVSTVTVNVAHDAAIPASGGHSWWSLGWLGLR